MSLAVDDEDKLVRKLATSWHLSVPERRALPGGKAKASLIYSIIEESLATGGWFPPSWRPDQPFEGGVIEHGSDGTFRIHWKAEIGVSRFELISVQECCSMREAVEAFVRRFFGESIDAVPIDWNA